MWKWSWCCVVSAFLLLGIVDWTQGAVHEARIARVQHIRYAAQAESEPAPVDLRLGKFLDDGSPSEPSDVFKVHWAPQGSEVRPGAILRFEYKQERVDAIQHLEIRYPFAVRERRLATFEISQRAAAAGGAVQAWRVRLVQDGVPIAEKTSGHWR